MTPFLTSRESGASAESRWHQEKLRRKGQPRFALLTGVHDIIFGYAMQQFLAEVFRWAVRKRPLTGNMKHVLQYKMHIQQGEGATVKKVSQFRQSSKGGGTSRHRCIWCICARTTGMMPVEKILKVLTNTVIAVSAVSLLATNPTVPIMFGTKRACNEIVLIRQG
ncbi:hypothetical protein TRVL_10181 [Trypanosoma vivax]|nr:hypothetical protein TRVL_10181 [Trypanosoma vivax]